MVKERIKQLLDQIDQTPKTVGWQLRNVVGDRVKWYQNVTEVAQ